MERKQQVVMSSADMLKRFIDGFELARLPDAAQNVLRTELRFLQRTVQTVLGVLHRTHLAALGAVNKPRHGTVDYETVTCVSCGAGVDVPSCWRDWYEYGLAHGRVSLEQGVGNLINMLVFMKEDACNSPK